MATLVGVVYDIATSTVRRIIVPDHDVQLNDPSCVQPGEAMLTVPMAIYEGFTNAAQISQVVTTQVGSVN
jgi:hypothetical protein